MKRPTLITLAVCVVAASLVAACGGSDNGSQTPPPTTGTATSPPATTSEAASTTAEATTTEAASTTAEAATTEAEDVVVATLRVVGGQPAGGVQKIELDKGQDVKLTVRSNQPHEIHVHGYDISKNAEPGAPAVFKFNANIDGVFEIELEDTATPIANLVVNP